MAPESAVHISLCGGHCPPAALPHCCTLIGVDAVDSHIFLTLHLEAQI